MKSSQIFLECERFLKRALKDKGRYTKGAVIAFLITGGIGVSVPSTVHAIVPIGRLVDAFDALGLGSQYGGATSEERNEKILNSRVSASKITFRDLYGLLYHGPLATASTQTSAGLTVNQGYVTYQGSNVTGGEDTTITGAGAIALGGHSQAVGIGTLALGEYSRAAGSDAMALGLNSNATATESVAVGHDARSKSDYSLALGSNSAALGQGSNAVGYNTNAGSNASLAIGYNTFANASTTGSEALTSAIATNSSRLSADTFAKLEDYKSYMFMRDNAKVALDAAKSNPSSTTQKIQQYEEAYKAANKRFTQAKRDLEAQQDYQNLINNTDNGALKTALETPGGIATFLNDNYNNEEFRNKVTSKVNTTVTPTGSNAIAIGNNTVANGNASIAQGVGTAALADASIALGAASQVDKYAHQSIAVGVGSQAYKENSISMGVRSATYGAGDVAIGNRVQIVGDSAVGVGFNTRVLSENGTAIGTNAKIERDSNNSLSMGYFSNVGAGSKNSIALGAQANINDGANSVAIGTSTQVLSENSVGLGNNAYVNGGSSKSVAIGASSKVMDKSAIAIGEAAEVSQGAVQSISIGKDSKAVGKDSVVLGTTALGNATDTIAIGNKATANNDQSIVIGKDASASRKNSIVLGTGSTDYYRGKAPKLKDGANPYANYTDPTTVYEYGSDGNVVYEEQEGANVPSFLPRGTEAGKELQKLDKLNLGVVSVGGGEVTIQDDNGNDKKIHALRRITNVAPGALDTDAVTVAQLRAWRETDPHFLSVNNKEKADERSTSTIGWDASGNTLEARNSNYLNDQALGSNNMALGKYAKADNKALSAIAIGAGSGAYGKYSIGLGTTVYAGGDQSIAIGSIAKSRGQNSMAMGLSAEAVGKDAMSIGPLSNARQEGALALGANSDARKIESIAFGRTAYANATSGIAIGKAAKIGLNIDKDGNDIPDGTWTGTRAIAIGESSEARRDKDIAIGYNSITKAGTALSIGSEATNYGENSVTIGSKAKVNPTGNDAKSTNSIAIGLQAEVTKKEAIAIGSSAKVDADNGVAIGKSASGSGTNAVALGKSATSAATSGIAIGDGATAKADANDNATTWNGKWSGNNTVAIGTGATAKRDQDVAIGRSASAKGGDAVALGSGAYTLGENSVAIGSNARVDDNSTAAEDVKVRANSIAIGRESYTNKKEVIAMGTGTRVTAKESVAIGKGVNIKDGAIDGVALGKDAAIKENATYGVAIGQGATINTNATYGTAIGQGAQIDPNATYATAVGQGAKVQSNSGAAFGTGATAAGVKTLALGSGAKATEEGSVALGSESVAGVAAGIQGWDPANGRLNTYDPAIAGHTASISGLGSVSVGAEGKLRQITNLSAGTQDTDAVNVAQLKATNLKITGNTTADAGADVLLYKQTLNVVGDGTYLTSNASGNTITMDLTQSIKDKIAEVFVTSFTGDQGSKVTPTATSNTVNVTGKKFTNGSEPNSIWADGGARYETGNVGTFTTGNTVAIGLRPELKSKSFTAYKYDGNNQTSTAGPSISYDSINMNGKPITNLANGVADGDAVNKSQLDAITWNLGAKGTDGTISRVVPSNDGNKRVDLVGDGGISVTANGSTVTISGSKILDAMPVVYTDAEGNRVYKYTDGKYYKIENPVVGKDKPVTNVQASLVSASPTTGKTDTTTPTIFNNVGSVIQNQGVTGNTTPTFTERLKVAATNNPNAAVNVNDLNSTAADLKNRELHITPADYTPNNDGDVSLSYSDGNGSVVSNTKATIKGVAKKSDLDTVKGQVEHTIALGDGTATGSTTAKSLKDGNVKFNIKSANGYITTAAAGDDVTLTFNDSGLAKTDLSNITDAGKNVITGLTEVTAGKNITVNPTTNTTTGKKTYEVVANDQVESVTTSAADSGDENIATVSMVSGTDQSANARYGVGVSKKKVAEIAQGAVEVTNGSDNVTVTPDTTTAGKTIYKVSVDKTKLAAGTNTTVEGEGTTAKPYKVNVAGDLTQITSITNAEGNGKVTFGANGVTTFTSGAAAGDKPVSIDGKQGHVNGLQNTEWNVTNPTYVSGRAATEDQLKALNTELNKKSTTDYRLIANPEANSGGAYKPEDGTISLKVKDSTKVDGTPETITINDVASKKVLDALVGRGITLGGDNNSATDKQTLANDVKFNITGDTNYITTTASGSNVKLSFNDAGLAKKTDEWNLAVNGTKVAPTNKLVNLVNGDNITIAKQDDGSVKVSATGLAKEDLSNITDAGKKVITGLGTKIEAGEGISVGTPTTDPTTGQTTYTISATKTKLVDGTNTIVEGEGTATKPYKVNVTGDLTNITSITNTAGTGKVSFAGNGVVKVDGDHPVSIDGKQGYINGLQNTTWNVTNPVATSGRAATEDQLKTVNDEVNNKADKTALWDLAVNNGTSTDKVVPQAGAQATDNKRIVLKGESGVTVKQENGVITIGAEKGVDNDTITTVFNTDGTVTVTPSTTDAHAYDVKVNAKKLGEAQALIFVDNNGTQVFKQPDGTFKKADGTAYTGDVHTKVNTENPQRVDNVGSAIDGAKVTTDAGQEKPNATFLEKLEVAAKDPVTGKSAVNVSDLKQASDASIAKAVKDAASNELHIKPTTDTEKYTVDGNGDVTLTYVNGDGTPAANTKAVISGIAKNDLSNITNEGKKVITGLGPTINAGDGITVTAGTPDATTGKQSFTIAANKQVESVTKADTAEGDENIATVTMMDNTVDKAANARYGVGVSKKAVANIAKDAVEVKAGDNADNVTVDKDTNTEGKTIYKVSVAKTKLAAGTNTTVEGEGTDAKPYKVNVTGDLTNITSITNTTGAGKVTFDNNGVVKVDGDHPVSIDGKQGYINGLQNTTWNVTNPVATSGRAATEDQLKAVNDEVNNKADKTALWDLAVNNGTSTDKVVPQAGAQATDNKRIVLKGESGVTVKQENGVITIGAEKGVDNDTITTVSNTDGTVTVTPSTTDAHAYDVKVNAKKLGEAQALIFVDNDGNQVFKQPDGTFKYADGNKYEGTVHTKVNTTAPQRIDNVGSAIDPNGTSTDFLGDLKTASEDATKSKAAVNVSDLKNASDASIAKAVTDATNKGMKYAGDNYKAADGITAEQNGITKKLGERLEIVGGAAAPFTVTDNIGVNAVNGKLKVQLAESLTGINSIAGKGGTNPFTISNGGTTLTINNGEGTNPGTISVGGARITNVANGTGNNDAVNVSQLNAVAGKELHVKPTTATEKYTVDTNGDVTLTYVNGNGEAVADTKAVISGVAKNDLSNITDDGKKVITGLGTEITAGDRITVGKPTVDATTGKKTYTISANKQVESVTTATAETGDENIATVSMVRGTDEEANARYGIGVSKKKVAEIAQGAVEVTNGSDNVTVNLDTTTAGKTVYKVSVAKIKLADGTNTTVEGEGTEAKPYEVNVKGNLGNITSITNTAGTGKVTFDNNGVVKVDGDHPVSIDSKQGYVTGLQNTTLTVDGFGTSNRAATEEQLKAVKDIADAASTTDFRLIANPEAGSDGAYKPNDGTIALKVKDTKQPNSTPETITINDVASKQVLDTVKANQWDLAVKKDNVTTNVVPQAGAQATDNKRIAIEGKNGVEVSQADGVITISAPKGVDNDTITTVTSTDGTVTVDTVGGNAHAYDVKVNAQKLGEAQALIFVDNAGNQVFKQPDGTFKKADGTPYTGDVHTKVNTATPQRVDNVGSAIDTAVVKDAAGAVKNNATYWEKLDKANTDTPNAAVNVSDIKNTANAVIGKVTDTGMKYGANLPATAGGEKVVTNKLGTTVNIVGTADVTNATEADKQYDGNNVVTSISQDSATGDTTVTVKLNKDLTSKSLTTNTVTVKGEDGKDGQAGKDAVVTVGEKGEPGVAGKDGKPGSDGIIGVNGKDGASVVIKGKDGTIGLTGPKGADGQPGKSINIGMKDGYNGADGADGVPGVRGEKGVDGQDGITRIVYTEGGKEHQVATMDDGMKYGGDNYKAATTTAAEQNVIAKKLNNRLDILGGATGTLTDNNIGVNADGGVLKVKLAESLTSINSIAGKGGTNPLTISNGGTTLTINPGTKTTGEDGTETVTPGNISVGGATITNVAKGSGDTDAVNVKQLKDEVGKAKTTVTVNNNNTDANKNLSLTTTTASDGHTNYDVRLADTVTLGTDATKQVTMDGTAGTITAGTGNNAVSVDGTNASIIAGTGNNIVKVDGSNGQLTAAGVVVGNQTVTPSTTGVAPTTGGTSETGNYVTGLGNTSWTINNPTYVSGRAATEDQLKTVTGEVNNKADKTALWDLAIASDDPNGAKVTPKDVAGDNKRIVLKGTGGVTISQDNGEITIGAPVAGTDNNTVTTVTSTDETVLTAKDTPADGNHAYALTINKQAIVDGSQLPVVYTTKDGKKVTIDKDGKFHTVDNPTVEVKPEDVETRIQSAAKSTTAGDTILNNVGSAIANTNVPEGTGTKQHPTFLERLEEAAKTTNHPNAAVNVSDLKQTSDAVIGKVTDTGMKYGANLPATAGGNKVVTNKLGSTVNIVGTADVTNATEADKQYDGNNVVTSISQDPATGDTTVTVKLNKDLTSKSLTTNTITVKGEDGKDGQPGKDAVVTVGEKGEPGVEGKPGKDGSNGTIGVNGKDGSAVVISGKDGSIGLTGPRGADGTPGKSINIGMKEGYDGEDGADGVPGVRGAKGVDGKDGITRIIYTEGGKEHQVATMDDGMKYAGDNYKAATTTAAEQNVIAKKLNNRLDILGGATGTLTDNNIGVNADGGVLKVKLAESLTGINSIAGKGGTNPLTISNGGTTLTINPGTKTTGEGGTETVTPGNISVGGATITNVAKGEGDTDAVNVKQLKDEVGKAKTTVTVNNNNTDANKNLSLTTTTAADGHTNYDVRLADTVTLGTDATKQVTMDGTAGTITAGTGNNTVKVDGSTGQLTAAGVVVGNQTLNPTAAIPSPGVIPAAETGNYVTGLGNTTWTINNPTYVSGRAATEDQLKTVTSEVNNKADKTALWDLAVNNGTSTDKVEPQAGAQATDNKRIVLKGESGVTVKQDNGVITISAEKGVDNDTITTVTSTDGTVTVDAVGGNAHAYDVKVNAQKLGEAQALIFVDNDGNQVFKQPDGSFKKADGTVYTGDVHTKANTAAPQRVDNVGSAIANINVPEGTGTKQNPTFLERLEEAAKATNHPNAAVNVSDLKNTANAVIGKVTDTGMKYGANLPATAGGKNVVTNKLGSTVNIVGTADVKNATEADKQYDGNNVITTVGQDANGDTTVTVKLNKDLTSKSLTTNTVTVKGEDGKDGQPGKDAVVTVGEKGEPGAEGKPGKDGSDGKIGVNGKDGSAVVINGKDGSIGLNGRDGANGLTMKGDKGAVGLDGTDGANGKDGMTRIVYETKHPDPNNAGKEITVKHEVATMDDGQKYSGDNYTAATATEAEANVINKKLNERLEIVGGAAAPFTATDNIGVNAVNGKLKVQLAESLTGINSIAGKGGTNPLTISNSGTTLTINPGTKTTGEGGTETVTPGNISVGGATITNVAKGEGDTDAVNVKQLKDEVGKAKTTVTVNNNNTDANKNLSLTTTTAADGHTNYDVRLADTVTLGTDATKQVTMDGTAGTITAGTGNNTVKVDGSKGQLTAAGVVVGNQTVTPSTTGVAPTTGGT
ncbi:hypothetical protein, partial [Veillonella sp. VA142]|uniref:hypothetical protein n=1 Tax=Veillonella sp. VA142 TaxID=741834 RepID=UPI0013DEF890